MTQVTIVGNLVDAPELRYTPGGMAVASFTIAENKRIKREGEWVDAEPVFWRCNIWRESAENATESLARGLRVIAVGEVVQRSFETKQGEKRTVTEVTVSDVGPSLRYATADVVKGKPKPSKAVEDPWGNETEPPF